MIRLKGFRRTGIYVSSSETFKGGSSYILRMKINQELITEDRMENEMGMGDNRIYILSNNPHTTVVVERIIDTDEWFVYFEIYFGCDEKVDSLIVLGKMIEACNTLHLDALPERLLKSRLYKRYIVDLAL